MWSERLEKEDREEKERRSALLQKCKIHPERKSEEEIDRKDYLVKNREMQQAL